MSDRKYRHRGYQDSSASEQYRSQEPRPQPRQERMEGAPRGRTAGGFGPDAFKCSRCGEAQQLLSELTHETLCRCGADLHTCTNCKNFDTSTRWECREPIEKRVSPKDARNECPSFAPRVVRDLSADKVGRFQSPEDARKAFENLFKK